MKKAGLAVKLPPNPAPHIVNWLIEIGLSSAAGMGVGPLAWSEINEWQAATGIALDAYEARLIRRLSVEFVAEGRRAEEETCPAPWSAPVTEDELKLSEAKLRMVLG